MNYKAITTNISMSTEPSEKLSCARTEGKEPTNRKRRPPKNIETVVSQNYLFPFFQRKRNKETSEDNILVDGSPLFSRGKRVGNEYTRSRRPGGSEQDAEERQLLTRPHIPKPNLFCRVQV